MAQIKIEDCTKEELIAFIRHEFFFQQGKLSSFIRLYRYEKLCEEAEQLRKKSIDGGKKLCDLLKKYKGMKFSDVTLSEIKKIRELREKNDDIWERSEIIQNRADSLLNEEAHEEETEERRDEK